jgi:hypothetical protein
VACAAVAWAAGGRRQVELKVDGNKLTGKLNELTIEGTVEGDVAKIRRDPAERREIRDFRRAAHRR